MYKAVNHFIDANILLSAGWEMKARILNPCSLGNGDRYLYLLEGGNNAE